MDNHQPDDPILTAKELAELLKVKVSWIYQKTYLGQESIPHLKVGNQLRFQKYKVLKHFGYNR